MSTKGKKRKKKNNVEISSSDQKLYTNYKEVLDILSKSSINTNSALFESFNEILTGSIKNSGIKNADKTSRVFNEAFTAALTKQEKTMSKSITDLFDKSLKYALGMSGLSGKGILIDPKSLLKLAINSNKSHQKMICKILDLVPSYYAEIILQKDFQIDVTKIRSESGKQLMGRLTACRPGTDWNEYENICKDILSFCFVPTLLEPIVQSVNESGSQRRDIIIVIPSNVTETWKLIYDKYGTSLIIECKDYSDYLDQNTFVISKKYFGSDKMTTFGFIITRKGMSTNAKVEQKRAWNKDKEMILCLIDEDMIKMIQLKEMGKNPAIIIEKAIYDFLISL